MSWGQVSTFNILIETYDLDGKMLKVETWPLLPLKFRTKNATYRYKGYSFEVRRLCRMVEMRGIKYHPEIHPDR